jgi:TPP-dependent trihydroxycyclohexane-1,2-dione (THcHDO) dehydratase
MWASWSRAAPLFSRFFRKPVDFSRDIKPILNQNCILCHGGVRQKNGVSFIFREAALGIGKSGRPTIVPGNPDGFQNPAVQFINIYVTEFDADKHAALPLVADARATLQELSAAMADYHVDASYRATIDKLRTDWEKEGPRLRYPQGASHRAWATKSPEA